MVESRYVVMGDRRYRLETPWGKLPDGMPFEQVSQVAVDSGGRVYVLQRGVLPVLVFDRTGHYLHALGEGLILDAHGIAAAPDDRIAVIDRDAHEIVIFDPKGLPLQTLGKRGAPRLGLPFNHPTDAAFARDGEIYVSDGYGNSAVHRFAADGTYLASWGSPGAGPGAFTTPHAIWVDRAERVLVADRENNRVQLFTRDGAFIDSWGDFYHPMDIFEDDRGFLFVTDQIPRVSMLAPDGTLVGRCRPVLNGAHGIWGDSDGSLYCAEVNPSRVTKLVPVCSAM